MELANSCRNGKSWQWKESRYCGNYDEWV